MADTMADMEERRYLTGVRTPRKVLYMNTNQVLEVRFTAKRALVWNNGNHRWQTIARDEALALIALGQAVELKAGQWI